MKVIMMDEEDLIGPLSEYITEEVEGVEVAISNGKVYLYSQTASTLSDGSFLSTCIGSIKIKENKLFFSALGREPGEIFALENPDSFDELFNKVKEIIERYASSYIPYLLLLCMDPLYLRKF